MMEGIINRRMCFHMSCGVNGRMEECKCERPTLIRSCGEHNSHAVLNACQSRNAEIKKAAYVQMWRLCRDIAVIFVRLSKRLVCFSHGLCGCGIVQDMQCTTRKSISYRILSYKPCADKCNAAGGRRVFVVDGLKMMTNVQCVTFRPARKSYSKKPKTD